MKKFIIGAAIGVLIVAASLSIHQPAAARFHINTHQNYSSSSSSSGHNKGIDALNEANDAITDYVTQINAIKDTADSAQISVAISSGTTLQNRLATLQQQSFDATTDENYQSAVTSLMSAAANVSSAAASLNAVLNSGSATNINTALQHFNSTVDAFDVALDTFSSAIQSYNTPIEEEQKSTGALYVIVSVVALAVTIATFAWRPERETARQKALRVNAAKQSLWPLGGALITTIWFFAADGGTYMVFWGAILLGFIIYIKALSDAIGARRNSEKGLAEATVSHARSLAPELIRLFKISKEETSGVTLLATLTLEGLYAFSLFNNPDDKAGKEVLEESLSKVEREINRLSLIDGQAQETKDARDKIYDSIMKSAVTYADTTLESRRYFAILGAIAFLSKEYAGKFSVTDVQDGAYDPLINELVEYQAVVNSYL